MRKLGFLACLCVGLLSAMPGLAADAQTEQPQTTDANTQQVPSQVGGTPGNTQQKEFKRQNEYLDCNHDATRAAFSAICDQKKKITPDLAREELYPVLRMEKKLLIDEIAKQQAKLTDAEERYFRADEGSSDEQAANYDRTDTKLKIQWLTSNLSTVETRLDDAFAADALSGRFKSETSRHFAYLIGVVILLFFGLVWAAKKDTPAGEIFSNQSGLQFITLFSVVISIAMFGVLGILEGKELSALLGAISGYVLGRVSAGEVQTALRVQLPGQSEQHSSAGQQRQDKGTGSAPAGGVSAQQAGA